MMTNNPGGLQVYEIGGQNLETVDEFVHLGALICLVGYITPEIKHRIILPNICFYGLG